MVEIKKLPPDRWQDYQALRLEALKSEPFAFGAAYEEEAGLTPEMWQRRIGDALFALDEDKPIGMVVYVFSDRVKNKHTADIYAMYVKNGYRNQGIGSKLLSGAISLIKQNKNILKIKISVNPEQKPAFKLYKKFGFSKVGIAKKEYIVGTKFCDEMLMEKLI